MNANQHTASRRSGLGIARSVMLIGLTCLVTALRAPAQSCQNVAGTYSARGQIVVSVTVLGQTQTETLPSNTDETIVQAGCNVTISETVSGYGTVNLLGYVQGNSIVFNDVAFSGLPSGFVVTSKSASGTAYISGNTITANNLVVLLSGTYSGVPFTGRETISGTLTRIADTTPPSLVVSWPAHHATVTGPYVAVSGSASDSGLGGNGVTQVTVNGVAASGGSTSGSGTAYWYASAYLGTGVQTLNIAATDGVGNTTSRSITVSTDPAWRWSGAYGWVWSAGNGWVWNSTFGWMWSSGNWTYSSNLQGWLGGDGSSRTVWSTQFQWLTTTEGTDYRAYTSTLGWIYAGKYQGTTITDGWVISDRFGYVWAAGDGVWFYSDRYGWLGVTAGGGIWCVNQGRFL